MAIHPLVENPGTVFAPRARLYVVTEDRKVVAGPLVVARRRAYHRDWLLGFVGVTSRAAVEPWRDHFIAVEDARELGHGYVGTEHLLLGLLHEGEGVAARVLTEAGVSLEKARSQIVGVLAKGR